MCAHLLAFCLFHCSVSSLFIVSLQRTFHVRNMEELVCVLRHSQRSQTIFPWSVSCHTIVSKPELQPRHILRSKQRCLCLCVCVCVLHWQVFMCLISISYMDKNNLLCLHAVHKTMSSLFLRAHVLLSVTSRYSPVALAIFSSITIKIEVYGKLIFY